MGSPPTDPDAREDEFPSHPVRISRPFYLGEKEVTVGQFRAFVEGDRLPDHRRDERQGRAGHVQTCRPDKIEQQPELQLDAPRDGTGPQAETSRSSR